MNLISLQHFSRIHVFFPPSQVPSFASTPGGGANSSVNSTPAATPASAKKPKSATAATPASSGKGEDKRSKVFACQHCGKSCKGSGVLARHIKAKHPNEEGKVVRIRLRI